MLVTIITDASHCQQTLVAGWSCWAVSRRGKRSASGAIKEKVKDSLIAESMAIVNSLHVAVKHGVAKSGDEVLIQTDCVAAINHMTWPSLKATVRKDILAVVNAFKAFRDTHGLVIEFRHVKGHSQNTDARSNSQRIQDRFAKRAMKSARKKLVHAGAAQ